MTNPTIAKNLARAYKSGWNASGNPRWNYNMDAAEANWLRRGHTAEEHDSWIAGWSDYAADYEYGHSA